MPELHHGDRVTTKLDNQKGWNAHATVTTYAHTSRSYVIQTENGLLRRNRQHLQTVPSNTLSVSSDQSNDQLPIVDPVIYHEKPPDSNPTGDIHGMSTDPVTTTRSGRVVKPKVRLDL